MPGDHVLIVSADPDDPLDREQFAYIVECPGVTERCQAWKTCTTEECNVDELLAADTSQPVLHGAEHRLIDDDWMVRSEGDCYVASHDHLPDAAPAYLNPGRYAISWFPGDGTELEILRARYVKTACGHIWRETWPEGIRIDNNQPRVCIKCPPDHPAAVSVSAQKLPIMPVVYFDEAPPELLLQLS
jgi:hypothetical protein